MFCLVYELPRGVVSRVYINGATFQTPRRAVFVRFLLEARVFVVVGRARRRRAQGWDFGFVGSCSPSLTQPRRRISRAQLSPVNRSGEPLSHWTRAEKKCLSKHKPFEKSVVNYKIYSLCDHLLKVTVNRCQQQKKCTCVKSQRGNSRRFQYEMEWLHYNWSSLTG